MAFWVDIKVSSYRVYLAPFAFAEIWVALEHSYHQHKIFSEFYRTSLKNLQLRSQLSPQTDPMCIW